MKSERGFTLVELMVTVIVVAVLAGIVAPSYEQFVKDNRLSSQINSLIGSLHFARSEATLRRSIVTMCASTDTSSCNTVNWEQGWIVFTDASNNGNAVVDGTDELLRFQEKLDGGNILRTSGFSFATDGQLSFAPTGFMRTGTTSSATAGTFTLCDDRGSEEARGVILTIAGASRLAVDENGNGRRDNHDGGGNSLLCP
ncbi:GspH/FimT family pseudopilin [Motiliproteus sp. MSK22-1]|uniref:GspH/FimT family pseudopilin n=1 Tax=Motiliproteus sp. MSK22-1 TaxID=1897630 RepID=UPI000978061C|nr:GspH/FimT family pseudopilin [Motiliproteus sp. MSK22-1]OMH34034.1 hypothetical protein BGP75_12005 [Motiliproteus sp. MSK22-1]